MAETRCDCCGQTIYRKLSVINKRTHHFCSNKCQATWTKINMPEYERNRRIKASNILIGNKRTKGIKLTEEHKHKISIANKNKKKRPFSIEHRKNMSVAKKGVRRKPHTIETYKKISLSKIGKPSGMKGKHHSVETKLPISKSQIGRIVSEETRKKMSLSLKGICSGARHYNWKGGTTYLPYCEKYNDQTKEKARAKYSYICLNCGKPQFENISKSSKIIKLDTHHIYYDKNEGCNGKNIEIIPLCMKCHRRTNFNRDYWQEHFKYLLLLWNIKEMIQTW